MPRLLLLSLLSFPKPVNPADSSCACVCRVDGVMRTMNTEKLLKTIPIIQNQMDALLDFNVSLKVKPPTAPVCHSGLELAFEIHKRNSLSSVFAAKKQ